MSGTDARTMKSVVCVCLDSRMIDESRCPDEVIGLSLLIKNAHGSLLNQTEHHSVVCARTRR